MANVYAMQIFNRKTLNKLHRLASDLGRTSLISSGICDDKLISHQFWLENKAMILCLFEKTE